MCVFIQNQKPKQQIWVRMSAQFICIPEKLVSAEKYFDFYASLVVKVNLLFYWNPSSGASDILLTDEHNWFH